jgi:diguanylate cyclase (GGDEF)-like protein/PAS domain S-box-containing protein
MISVSDINFRILTYEVNAGIYVTDPKGNFIYANLALANIFEVEHPRDILGKNFKDFISPGSANAFMDQFRKSMVSGSDPKMIPAQITKHDGKKTYIEVNAMPFVKNRTLAGNQGVVHDITPYVQVVNKTMQSRTHDPLTGIFNRTFFEAEMKRLERGRQYPISIIALYVEGLRKSREAAGKEDRDKTLTRIARQLFYTFRGDDIVARFGENEFAVLLPTVDEKIVEGILSRLQADLQKIKREIGAPALNFFTGVGTANSGESLNATLKKAEAIAELKMKSRFQS